MKEDFDPRRRLSTNSKNSYRSFILENSFFDGLLDAAGGDEEEEVEKKGGKRRSDRVGFPFAAENRWLPPMSSLALTQE